MRNGPDSRGCASSVSTYEMVFRSSPILDRFMTVGASLPSNHGPLEWGRVGYWRSAAMVRPVARLRQNLTRRVEASTTWIGIRGKSLNGTRRWIVAATGFGQYWTRVWGAR